MHSELCLKTNNLFEYINMQKATKNHRNTISSLEIYI